MPDKTERDLDKRLRSLEGWLQELYKDAEKEMRGKWDKYLARQEKRAETLLSRIREAKTDEEKKAAERKYKQFLRSKTSGDKHFRDMVDELAWQYSNANASALAMINGSRYDFFAGGYNISAEEVNHVAIQDDIDIRFNLCNPGTVKYLYENKGGINMPGARYLELTRDQMWNVKLLNAQLAQGIVQGESIPKIAARLQNVTQANEKASIRYARTMATGCQNAGRIQNMKTAADMGVKTRKEWVCTHDNRTRDSHLEIDGETVAPDAEFSNGCRYPGDPIGPPQEVWNCRCTLATIIDGFSPLLPKGHEGSIHVTIDGKRVT